MPGERGATEKQILAFDREEELSKHMAELGIQHFYISRSPLEGTQVTGSDKETAQRLQKFLSVQYEEWVSDKEMILGGELDRYGTRKNKRELLKAGFKTALLPLPMPWKEIR